MIRHKDYASFRLSSPPAPRYLRRIAGAGLFNRRSSTDLSSLAEAINSQVRGWINIVSDKPDAYRDFYVGLLGFQVAMDMGWIMTFVSPGNPTAQVSVLREDASAPVIPQITVEVTDVGKVHAARLFRPATGWSPW